MSENASQKYMKIIECPRDAMQGLHEFIPTTEKVRYLQQLLKIGFDTLDFGSFVSPKAIPQMKDTRHVLEALDLSQTRTKLLAIVANLRGARDASQYDSIEYLGYPFSISETFQLRNTNATIEESVDRVKQIQELCLRNNKKLVIYISMGFGNPYGDYWDSGIVEKWISKLRNLDIRIIQLSDTIGVAKQESITYLFDALVPLYEDVEIGAHFHTTPNTWYEKVHSAYQNGCRRFDGTIKGYGGCPMAQNKLVGNMPSEMLIQYAQDMNIKTGLRLKEYGRAVEIASDIFL